jgi:hypothetical protein
MNSQPKPIEVPPGIAARCDSPDQAERMDQLLRAVIAVPKATIDKEEAKWKLARARKKRPAKLN